ncbi:hypothetical protein [Streptomyces roseoverticillatus]|uniref:hypothetical protein n=1 Tax=Streptomyces roseoverticillatus TaxID=66429 RepID=UPI001F20976C|nr:hypothetical protein [Streptomyces roseoverticillatus]
MARGVAGAVAEVLAWWAGLTAVWTVLISRADTLELAVGAGAALLAACAARGARRAADR